MLGGLMAGAIGFFVYALAPNSHVFLAGLPIVALWGVTGPAAQGLLTRRVAADAQGELQGAMGSLQGIATMIGPIVFASTFAWSIDASTRVQFPGAAYALAAAVLLASAFIARQTTRVRAVA
jgi:DHA1 family tetracycline resistance protein-like MFS transporter